MSLNITTFLDEFRVLLPQLKDGAVQSNLEAIFKLYDVNGQWKPDAVVCDSMQMNPVTAFLVCALGEVANTVRWD